MRPETSSAFSASLQCSLQEMDLMGFTLQPATKEHFVDREKMIGEMIATLTDPHVRMGFALVGPRRIGKTSILKEVTHRLSARNDIVAVYFSLWDMIEHRALEFCNRLTYTILDAFKGRLSKKYKVHHLIKVPASKLFDFLRTIDFRIAVLEDVEMTLHMRERDKEIDVNTVFEKVFGLVENLSRDIGVRSVLILDEFPSIMDLKNGQKLGEGALRKIRTLQENFEHTVLCISGSIRKTMEMAALSPSSAFYRQFIVKHIGPFDREATEVLIKRNLGKTLSNDAMDRLFARTGGIPFYIQFAHEKIETHDVSAAFDDLLDEEGDLLFTEAFKALSDKERWMLSVMAVRRLEVPGDLSRAVNENSNVVSRYLSYFIEKGILEKKAKGKYHFVDPVFEQWLIKRYGDVQG